MKLFTNEVKIALVAIAGIVVLFFGLQYLKGLTLLSGGDTYYVQFEDVSGLSASSPIYANGYRVGTVKSIDYDYTYNNKVVAAIGLASEMKLPRGTHAEIAADLLGNVKLELKFGPDRSDLLAFGDTLMGEMNRGSMGKAADMLPQIEAMLPKLDSILAHINLLLADPAIGNTLHNVDDITSSLTVTSQQLSLLSKQLNHQLPQMMAKADGVLTNTEGLTRQLGDLDFAATMNKVDATLANVQQMTAALNSKEGTLGLLMRDPSLYMNLSNTMRDADSLMIDLKAHPKRYIHFSVFGKKDK
jgi:phospholipid/cholesterol/gamma-HCH transport system substrate-binding protein